jgi:hypothetical protein
MRIMTIAALDQALVDSMVERHLKLRLLLEVAGVTELRLCFGQQKLFDLGMMRRVTGDATHIILAVDRVDGIHVLRATGVTGHTTDIDVFRRSVLECEDLADIAAPSHMVRTRTMATLAPLVRRAARLIQCGFPVWRFLPAAVNLSMARLARLRSNVLGQFGRRRAADDCTGRLSALPGSRLASLPVSKDNDKSNQNRARNASGPRVPCHENICLKICRGYSKTQYHGCSILITFENYEDEREAAGRPRVLAREWTASLVTFRAKFSPKFFLQ